MKPDDLKRLNELADKCGITGHGLTREERAEYDLLSCAWHAQYQAAARRAATFDRINREENRWT